MDFQCEMLKEKGEKQRWTGHIVRYKYSEDILEMYIESRSSIHVIMGKSTLGNFILVPNFNAGCYLSRFNDLFWNSEKLSEIMGKVDGITIATAIQFIEHRLML